jgi:hypothetical protein
MSKPKRQGPVFAPGEESWLEHTYTQRAAKAYRKLADDRLEALYRACESTECPRVREVYARWRETEEIARFLGTRRREEEFDD